MGRLDFPVSIVEFQRRFADDAACLGYLAGRGGRPGSPAPRAAAARHGGWRHLWECAGCGRQTSVTAGTIMDHTHTPLSLWFWSAHLVATHTPGISAVQLHRQLGISRYETAWFLLHKLRAAMAAPERGLLTGEVEADEGFIGGRNPARRGGRVGTGAPAGTARRRPRHPAGLHPGRHHPRRGRAYRRLERIQQARRGRLRPSPGQPALPGSPAAR
jgi:hypothetical protein